MAKRFSSRASFQLRRFAFNEPWFIEWAPFAPDVMPPFVVMVHDEMKRFPGLEAYLKNRLGIFNVSLQISGKARPSDLVVASETEKFLRELEEAREKEEAERAEEEEEEYGEDYEGEYKEETNE